MNDLFIDLLNKKISIYKAKKEQNEMILKIEKLKNFIFSEQKIIANKSNIMKAKTRTQRKNIIVGQKSVIKNAMRLYDKITIIINAFENDHIYPGDV